MSRRKNRGHPVAQAASASFLAPDSRKNLPAEARGMIANARNDITIPYWSGVLQHTDDTLIQQGGGKGLAIYDEIERDTHAFAMLQKRKKGLTARGWEVEPGGDRPIDKDAAELVKDLLTTLPFDRICEDMLDATLKGFSVSEIVWARDGDRIVPAGIRAHDQRRFVFGEDWQPRLLTWTEMVEGQALPARKFIVHRFGVKGNNPYGLGLGTRLFWAVLFKREGVAFWLHFLEKFAGPTIVGKTPYGMLSDEQNRLLQTLVRAKTASAITVPLGTDIEFLEASRSGSVSYEQWLAYWDRQISICVTGETLTTQVGDSGGNRALGEVHQEMLDLLVDSDGDLLSGAIAGTRGSFMAGVLGMDANGGGVGYNWLLTVDQATIPVNYTDYAIYIKGAEATPSGAGTIASPRSMGTDIRFLCPSMVFNQVGGTNDGNYRMLLGVASIEVVNEDAGELVNAGTTQIDPGRIRITGGTTLADWRTGGDETRINGGMISANTIKANSLEIGSRNITLTGIQFEHNSPSQNQVSWTAGNIRWINDAGDTVSSAISAGQATWTSGIGYIYWVKAANVLSWTTTQAVAFGVNNVILATYQGGKALDPDYGRTVIDGTDIKTGTLTADRVNSTSFYNAGLSVFGGTLASDNFNAAAGTGWRITKAGVMNMPHAIVDTLQLKDGAVSTMWSANAASLTISASYPMRLLVLTNIRVAGVNNTYSANGYIRRNGVDVESASYSVGVYSWMLTMFKTVDIAAGNHTFNHAYTGTAADYSQPRIAIFGTYK